MQFYSAATTILVGILLLGLTARGQQPKLSDRIKENIISEVFGPDPGMAASAIRLSFHDCVGSCIGETKSQIIFDECRVTLHIS